MCCYQEGIAKTKIGERDVTAHISEYTIQISTSPSFKIETSEKGVAPVQVNILPQREKPKESKFPPMALQRLRTNPPTQRLRPPRRLHNARSDLNIPPLESLRHKLQLRRRNRSSQRQIRRKPSRSRSNFRIQNVQHLR